MKINEYQNKVCCFIGHRKIDTTKELKDKLFNLIEDLIKDKNVRVFLFGSRSEFNTLCYDIVSTLKKKYLFIKRIYVRGEFQYISDQYKDKYFLNGYEDSFLPDSCKIASKATYVERNKFMIDESDFCVFYFKNDYKPEVKKISNRGISGMYTSEVSGTKKAYEYALKKEKNVLNILNLSC